jgi:hypothetical protein
MATHTYRRITDHALASMPLAPHLLHMRMRKCSHGKHVACLADLHTCIHMTIHILAPMAGLLSPWSHDGTIRLVCQGACGKTKGLDQDMLALLHALHEPTRFGCACMYASPSYGTALGGRWLQFPDLLLICHTCTISNAHFLHFMNDVMFFGQSRSDSSRFWDPNSVA